MRKKAGFEVEIRLFTFDSLNPHGGRTGDGEQALFCVRISDTI